MFDLRVTREEALWAMGTEDLHESELRENPSRAGFMNIFFTSGAYFDSFTKTEAFVVERWDETVGNLK